MKVWVSIILCMSWSLLYGSDSVSLLESQLRQSIERYRELSNKINVPGIPYTILINDSVAIKTMLQDVMALNKTITTQIDTALGFWNMYLDTFAMTNKEGYLMGQVMASFLSTLRSLFLRSNIDQAMLLSLLKKSMDNEEKLLARTVNAQVASINEPFDLRMEKLRRSLFIGMNNI